MRKRGVRSMNQLDLPWDELDANGNAIFCYDLDSLSSRAKALESFLRSFAPNSSLSFSIKANPHPRVLLHLSQFVQGFDASSELELQLCQRLGVSGPRISVSGPGKTDECLNLTKAMQVGVLQVDSLPEFEFAKKIGISNLSFRIYTPDMFSAKLGLNPQDLAVALADLKTPALGLHTYLGREVFSWQKLTAAVENMSALFDQYPKSFSSDPQLYIGPGLPANWNTSSAEHPKTKLPATFEIGRALVAECGFYSVQILSRKQLDRGGEALIVNGGLQHLGSPFVSLAQKQPDPPVKVIRRGSWLTEESAEFLVAGSLCLGHDILRPRLSLPKNIQAGDWIVFPRAGAYGLSAGVTFFIGQELPREFIFENNKFEDQTLKDFRLYHECFKL